LITFSVRGFIYATRRALLHGQLRKSCPALISVLHLRRILSRLFPSAVPPPLSFFLSLSFSLSSFIRGPWFPRAYFDTDISIVSFLFATKHTGDQLFNSVSKIVIENGRRMIT